MITASALVKVRVQDRPKATSAVRCAGSENVYCLHAVKTVKQKSQADESLNLNLRLILKIPITHCLDTVYRGEQETEL